MDAGVASGLLHLATQGVLSVENGSGFEGVASKRPDAAKQIGNVLGPFAVFRDQRSQRFLAGGGGLQERTGRQREARFTDRDGGRRPHQNQLAMTGQPRESVLLGYAR